MKLLTRRSSHKLRALFSLVVSAFASLSLSLSRKFRRLSIYQQSFGKLGKRTSHKFHFLFKILASWWYLFTRPTNPPYLIQESNLRLAQSAHNTKLTRPCPWRFKRHYTCLNGIRRVGFVSLTRLIQSKRYLTYGFGLVLASLILYIFLPLLNSLVLTSPAAYATPSVTIIDHTLLVNLTPGAGATTLPHSFTTSTDIPAGYTLKAYLSQSSPDISLQIKGEALANFTTLPTTPATAITLKTTSTANLLDTNGQSIPDTINLTYSLTAIGMPTSGNRPLKITYIVEDNFYGSIAASTTAPTNQDVTLTLTTTHDLPSANTPTGWTRVNDHTFTKIVSTNGTYEVSFTNTNNETKTASYDVTNIDKTAPIATVSYNPSLATPANQTTVTLAINEVIDSTSIINLTNQGWTPTSGTNNQTWTKLFTDNHTTTQTITFKDLAGNQGQATYQVTNIIVPKAYLEITPDTDANGTPTIGTHRIVLVANSVINTPSGTGWTTTDNKIYTKTEPNTNTTTQTITITNAAGKTNTDLISYNVGNLSSTNTMQTTTKTYCTTHLNTFHGDTGTILVLEDTRGGITRTYRTAKLADNNCWMLDNLKLGSTTATTALTSADSNIPVGQTFTLPQLQSGPTGMSYSYDTPRAYGPVPNDSNSTDQTNYVKDAQNYGYLYNYCTATAGTIETTTGVANYTCKPHDTYPTDLDGNPVNTTNYNPVNMASICPKGWRLPTGGSGGEFVRLNIAFGSQSNTKWNYGGPFKGVLSGSAFYSFYGQGSVARLWSATANPSSTSNAHSLYFYPSNVYPADGVRSVGLAIRCLLD